MPSFQLPLTADFGTFPENFNGTPQEFSDRMAANARFFSTLQFALFVTGATAPTSNVGPWLANGNEWRVWDDGTGAYVPITIDQQSLGYYIGSSTPDQNVYQFWIQTSVSGQPLALKIYYSGAWTDVYASTLSGYQTVAAMSAYYTSAQTDAAIANAIAAIPSANAYPVRAEPSVTQSLNITGSGIKINFGSEVFDPDNVFSTVTSRYTAPVNGVYSVAAELQVDNNTGTASGMEMNIYIVKNGVTQIAGSGTSVASPPGSRWYPQVTSLCLLQAGDTIEITLAANDGVNTGAVDISTNSSFNINLVQAT